MMPVDNHDTECFMILFIKRISYDRKDKYNYHDKFREGVLTIERVLHIIVCSNEFALTSPLIDSIPLHASMIQVIYPRHRHGPSVVIVSRCTYCRACREKHMSYVLDLLTLLSSAS
jgi:hypothetical protein